MIFTTVLVTCLVALLGAFQHISLDIFSLTQLRYPTLSSVTAFLQVAGLDMRLTLDAPPLPGLDLFFGQLRTEAFIDDGFANPYLNHTLPLFIPDLDAFFIGPIYEASITDLTPELEHDSEPAGRFSSWRSIVTGFAVLVVIIFVPDIVEVSSFLPEAETRTTTPAQPDPPAHRFQDTTYLGHMQAAVKQSTEATRAVLREHAPSILVARNFVREENNWPPSFQALFSPASLEDIYQEFIARPAPAYSPTSPSVPPPASTSSHIPVLAVDTNAGVEKPDRPATPISATAEVSDEDITIRCYADTQAERPRVHSGRLANSSVHPPRHGNQDTNVPLGDLALDDALDIADTEVQQPSRRFKIDKKSAAYRRCLQRYRELRAVHDDPFTLNENMQAIIRADNEARRCALDIGVG